MCTRMRPLLSWGGGGMYIYMYPGQEDLRRRPFRTRWRPVTCTVEMLYLSWSRQFCRVDPRYTSVIHQFPCGSLSCTCPFASGFWSVDLTRDRISTDNQRVNRGVPDIDRMCNGQLPTGNAWKLMNNGCVTRVHRTILTLQDKYVYLPYM